MKAIIWTRVSSVEQEYGKSLDAQMLSCRQYAANKGFNVLKEFSISESSTRGNRKKFNEMIRFVLSQEGVVRIITYSVDRFQRRFEESVDLMPFIESGKIEIHFIATGLVISKNSKPAEYMMWDYNVVGARSYVLQLREGTKRGIQQKIRDGEWPTTAPIGYLNYIDGKYRKIKVDEERAPLIKMAFEEYATGLYSIDEIVRRLHKRGLRSRGKRGRLISKNAVHRMLQNPFYYGMMKLYNGAKFQPHIYPRLISKSLFDQCEEVRLGRKKSFIKNKGKEFLFKGMVRCGKCGHLVSPYKKVKKSGKVYNYLRCAQHALNNSCDNEQINEKIALDRITEGLQAITIPESMAEKIRQELIKYNQEELQTKSVLIKEANRTLAVIKQKIDRLVDLRLQDGISDVLFKQKIKELQDEQARLEESTAESKAEEGSLDVSIEEVLGLAKDIGEIFKSSQIEGKKEIINCVFANLSLEQKNLYFSYKKPFNLFVEGLSCTKLYRGRDLNP